MKKEYKTSEGKIMAIDRVALFSSIRSTVFHGHFNQSQVDGINFILDEWEARPEMTDMRWLAYMLGTAYHETASTMQPVHEYGGNAYFTRMYDILGNRSAMARRMGNTQPGDGIKYCGRGYVQLTWKNNYLNIGKEIGINLVANPDLAMDPKIAAKVMFAGMTKNHLGFDTTFSGVSLDRYFNDNTEDWVGARQIINGRDHADMIAETAQDFYDALP